ncbi:MAG: nucleotidyl transferase AbiEii/AbiGii toxin family protein [Candidatus Omnitrophota bacterium]
MSERSVFHLISEVTSKAGVSCILIGGFAVNCYKVTRQTVDLDFLITKDDFDKIRPALEKAGYKQITREKNFAQLKSSRLSLLDVDFMFVEGETFAKIIGEGREVKIAGQKFIVPSLEHLLALKLHSIKFNPKLRLMRDLPDIVNLIRINKVNVNSEKFKELCLKYGTGEIYDKILEILK